MAGEIRAGTPWRGQQQQKPEAEHGCALASRDPLSRLEDRNPSANEVIHDRQICMLLSLLSVCSLCPRFISMLSPLSLSLSLLSFHYDSATLTDCIQSVVHSCSKCLHSHNRLLPSSSSAPSPPPPPPPPREAIESGGQKTA